MASSSGGYDKDFQQKPPDTLICHKCHLVARDPQQTRCDCNQIYCKSCLEILQSKSDKCSKCKKNFNSFPNELRALKIKVLQVKCDARHNGCKWVGVLWQLETHLKCCNLTEVQCPNNCSRKLLRKDLKRHLSSECPLRLHLCPHCKEEGQYQMIVHQHLETCPEIKVTCPYSGCGETMKQKVLHNSHLQICPQKPVSCSYKDIGCTHEVASADLEQHHTEYAAQHLTLLTAIVKEQKKAMVEMEQRLLTQVQETLQRQQTAVESRCQTLERQQQIQSAAIKDIAAHLQRQPIKLSSFSVAKRNNKVWYSNSFYHSGYKMSVCVHANGHRNAKDSHVSIFIHLMKGMHDNSLQWPLQGEVTFQLLNQLADKRHVSKSLQYTSDRVTTEGERGMGQGFDHFISHHNLEHNKGSGTQYLMDDSIYIRVSVKVTAKRPWLMAAPTENKEPQHPLFRR